MNSGRIIQWWGLIVSKRWMATQMLSNLTSRHVDSLKNQHTRSSVYQTSNGNQDQSQSNWGCIAESLQSFSLEQFTTFSFLEALLIYVWVMDRLLQEQRSFPGVRLEKDRSTDAGHKTLTSGSGEWIPPTFRRLTSDQRCMFISLIAWNYSLTSADIHHYMSSDIRSYFGLSVRQWSTNLFGDFLLSSFSSILTYLPAAPLVSHRPSIARDQTCHRLHIHRRRSHRSARRWQCSICVIRAGNCTSHRSHRKRWPCRSSIEAEFRRRYASYWCRASDSTVDPHSWSHWLDRCSSRYCRENRSTTSDNSRRKSDSSSFHCNESVRRENWSLPVSKRDPCCVAMPSLEEWSFESYTFDNWRNRSFERC